MSGKPKEPLTIEEQHQVTTMSAAGYSLNKIAKTIGRSSKAVRNYLGTDEAIAEVRDERQELVEIYREKARACVVAIDNDKIAKSSVLQLATSSGILLDKSLLLTGKPTQNVAVLIEVCDLLRQQDDAESERQYQQEKAKLLALPAKQP
jgi:predicted transcriptional regulator